MEGLGLDPEKDFDAIYTATLAEGPMMILEGRAAALWGAGNRWPRCSTRRAGRAGLVARGDGVKPSVVFDRVADRYDETRGGEERLYLKALPTRFRKICCSGSGAE